MPAEKKLLGIQMAVFGGFERRNEHGSVLLEIGKPPKMSTYFSWQMNHPQNRCSNLRLTESMASFCRC